MQEVPGGSSCSPCPRDAASIRTTRAEELPGTTACSPKGQQETGDLSHVPPNSTHVPLGPCRAFLLWRVKIGKEKADVHFCIENIYFTTVVSDNLAMFILVYIQTYNTQITMLKQKIIPSAVTACMYRSSVVSSVTIHKVQTATSTYIQFKVWSFSNITKYIYVYIIITFQMHLYFDCDLVLVFFFSTIFFFSFFKDGLPPPHPARVEVQCKCRTHSLSASSAPSGFIKRPIQPNPMMNYLVQGLAHMQNEYKPPRMSAITQTKPSTPSPEKRAKAGTSGRKE